VWTWLSSTTPPACGYRYDGTASGSLDQRYYSSGAGRFQTPDPSRGVDLADPGAWNKYTYVQGDPANFLDPIGTNRADPDAWQGPSYYWGYGFYSYWGEEGYVNVYAPYLYFMSPGGGGGGGGGDNSTSRSGTDPHCDRNDPTNAKVLDHIWANQAAASELSSETGLSVDFILAWGALESGYGTGSAARLNNNFFGLTAPAKNRTGGWTGAIPCSSLSTPTFSGFACFPTDLSDDDFSTSNNNLYLSGVAALFSQNRKYLDAALAAQAAGGDLAAIGNAVASAGFNSEPINYGASVKGVANAIALRINCPH
jgi:RHS repeat-associated protein